MSDSGPKKQFGPVDKWREMSGLYKLGFDMESLKGFLFPFIAVTIAVVLAVLIAKYL